MAKQRGNVFDHRSSSSRPQSRPRPKLDETADDESDKRSNGTSFNPSDPFLLSDLIDHLDSSSGNGNYFQFPSGAQAFLRRVLSSGSDFRFVPMGQTTKCGEDGGGNGVSHDIGDDNVVAFITTCLHSRDVRINLAFPPPRVGEAICHELLHHEDFGSSGFRPMTSLVYCRPAGLRGAAAAAATECQDAPTRAFQPLIAKLVNLISHEYVKAKLEEFGYSEPFVPAMKNQIASLRFMLRNLEVTMSSLSEQLAKVGDEGATRKGKRPIRVEIYSLQSMYEDLILLVLMDELLFVGEYTNQIDAVLLLRFQHVLDYVFDCTSRSSDGGRSFRRIHWRVDVVAEAVRDACKRYRTVTSGAIVDGAEDRYKLLVESLNAIYDAVGVQFGLLAQRNDEAPSISIDAAPHELREDAPFLDGEYTFDDATAFAKFTSEEDGTSSR